MGTNPAFPLEYPRLMREISLRKHPANKWKGMIGLEHHHFSSPVIRKKLRRHFVVNGPAHPLEHCWHHYKERAFFIGFLVLCASSCVLPHRRYSLSSPQRKAESDRVSRLHCQWLGGTVIKAEQVIRPQGRSQQSLQREEQTNCREKERKKAYWLKETSETYQSGAVGRPCLGSDMIL